MKLDITGLIQDSEFYIKNTADGYSGAYQRYRGIVLIIRLLLSLHKRLDHFEEVIKEEWDYPSENR